MKKPLIQNYTKIMYNDRIYSIDITKSFKWLFKIEAK